MEETGQLPTDDHLYLGAASEHVVAAYYLGMKYPVFWPAYTHGPFDLIVDIDGVLKRVQVRTAGWVNKGNGYTYLQVQTGVKSDEKPRYDILLVVYGDDLWEIPAEDLDVPSLYLQSLTPGYESRWERYRI